MSDHEVSWDRHLRAENMSRDQPPPRDPSKTISENRSVLPARDDALTLIFTKLSLAVFLVIAVALMVSTLLYNSGY